MVFGPYWGSARPTCGPDSGPQRFLWPFSTTPPFQHLHPSQPCSSHMLGRKQKQGFISRQLRDAHHQIRGCIARESRAPPDRGGSWRRWREGTAEGRLQSSKEQKEGQGNSSNLERVKDAAEGSRLGQLGNRLGTRVQWGPAAIFCQCKDGPHPAPVHWHL